MKDAQDKLIIKIKQEEVTQSTHWKTDAAWAGKHGRHGEKVNTKKHRAKANDYLIKVKC